jgi:hypothetical protein
MDENEKLSLVNLKGGAAVEMFDLALQRVLDNVADINMTGKPREIVLKVKIVPTDDRTLIGYEIEINSKLAGQAKQSGTADLRIDERGRHYGADRIQAQRDLGFKFSNVTKLN